MPAWIGGGEFNGFTGWWAFLNSPFHSEHIECAQAGAKASDVRLSEVPKGASIETHASANRLKKPACSVLGGWGKLGSSTKLKRPQ